ncbi:hypothetical protein AVEN_154674-1 [Araneus ventricosus]|uniref:Uncharacterized protein n=1 Tax=Araneus ventricosus TaxID=182803 RepID=A0A4Y2LAV8_ARAVE|nr:hypothetical protein AVEN_26458-1 [Araneus ventricosus]GBN11026.1 hypothetical protein AVEN_154674-1 [Araneus ventricosus]
MQNRREIVTEKCGGGGWKLCRNLKRTPFFLRHKVNRDAFSGVYAPYLSPQVIGTQRKAELLPYSRMTTALRVGHALLLKSYVSELLSPMLNHGLNANGCYAKNFYYYYHLSCVWRIAREMLYV